MAFAATALAQSPGNTPRAAAPARSPALLKPAPDTAFVADVIDSVEIAGSHATTLSELLIARRPGLYVMRNGGTFADGSRVSFRGATSIVGPRDPLVVVDGMIVSADQVGGGSSGTMTTSRLDDIPPETVARIELLPGAAATARYGNGASNGVIAITTKRGGGPVRVTTGGEIGTVLRSSFPSNYGRASGTPENNCTLARIAGGFCAPGPLLVFNPLNAYSPFRMGRLAAAEVSIGGAMKGIDSQLQGSIREDVGTLATDGRSRRHVGGSAMRGFASGVAIGITGSTTRRDDGLSPLTLISTDNVVMRSLLGYATDTGDLGRLVPFTTFYGALVERTQHDRGSVFIRFNDSTRVRASFAAGTDYHVSVARSMRDTLGWPEIFGSRGRSNELAADFGVSYGGSRLHHETAVGGRHRVGTQERSVANGTTIYYRRFVREASRSLWLTQQASFGRSLRVQGSVTRISDDFYDHASLLPSALVGWSPTRARPLALRARFGEALVDEISELLSRPLQIATSSRPRTRELEIGIDTKLSPAVDLAVSVYESHAKGLGMRVFSPSPYAPDILFNRGGMLTRGVEGMARVSPAPRRLGLTPATITVSWLRNRVVALGALPSYITSGDLVEVAGYPDRAIQGFDYTYRDANGDGVISPSEVTTSSTARIVGSSTPTRTASFDGGVALGALHVKTVVDYRGGFSVVNGLGLYRCRARVLCQEAYDASAPLADQARAAAALNHPLTNAYREAGDFIRLREVSASLRVHTPFLRALGGGDRDVTLAVIGRDLATFTHYRGLDPEITSAPYRRYNYDFLALPLPRRFFLRFDVSE